MPLRCEAVLGRSPGRRPCSSVEGHVRDTVPPGSARAGGTVGPWSTADGGTVNDADAPRRRAARWGRRARSPAVDADRAGAGGAVTEQFPRRPAVISSPHDRRFSRTLFSRVTHQSGRFRTNGGLRFVPMCVSRPLRPAGRGSRGPRDTGSVLVPAPDLRGSFRARLQSCLPRRPLERPWRVTVAPRVRRFVLLTVSAQPPAGTVPVGSRHVWEIRNAAGHRQVVQRREGFRLHRDRRQRSGRVRALLGDPGRRASGPSRRTSASRSRRARAPRARRPTRSVPSRTRPRSSFAGPPARPVQSDRSRAVRRP